VSETLLEIKNLDFSYGKGKPLFKDFSLCVKRGEIVAIVGESGKGKSTLFDLIAGFKKPLSGTIYKSGISFIFQDPYSSFHPNYSIKKQIEDVAKVELDYRLLEETLMLSSSLIQKKPHELSGGQLQRFSIFRAIMMNAELILADEPTSALDNVVSLEVMKALVGSSAGRALLLITHDSSLAEWCSDRTIRL